MTIMTTRNDILRSSTIAAIALLVFGAQFTAHQVAAADEAKAVFGVA